MSRMADLLRLAAEGLDKGAHPFCDEFLSGHQVTLDECFDLAAQMAAGARMMAWVQENPRDAAAFLASGSAGMALDAITRALEGTIMLSSATGGKSIDLPGEPGHGYHEAGDL